MASIAHDFGKRKRIQFQFNGARRQIRLGVATQKQAEVVRYYVEILALGVPDPDAIRWAEGCGDKLHKRLANVGLVRPRECTNLGPWLDRFIVAKTYELKSASIVCLKKTRDLLLEFFGANTPIRHITPNQASEWKLWLQQKHCKKVSALAAATVNHRVGDAKGFFADAERRSLVPRNPFAHLGGGSIAAVNERYITPDECDAVLAACPDIRWKVLFGLTRLAGLRCESETHQLRWSDVDFQRKRLTVRSPKTERFPTHAQRIVPIGPKLMKVLQEARPTDIADNPRVVVLINGGRTRRKLCGKILPQAGVQPWKRLWQTLRSSCEKEWAMKYPQFAVSKWIGHSITISGKYYVNNVPDALMDQVANSL